MATSLPVVPTPRQVRHHGRAFYGFVHFTTNTFTDKEWGYGDETPGVFDPTEFDADQIVDSAKLAGMTGLILTCKHHDGFCLWPSAFTAHTVRQSPFRGGRGDVVREMADACRQGGIEFGVYLSPWDRNRADYGTPAYIDYFRKQMRELLTGYGEVFEVWYDGANGGDGYYGGARETRTIDPRTYYDWPNTWQLVRELQPEAVIFGDGGPDVRWIGNESGIAGDPCWCTINAEGVVPGTGHVERLNRGERDGTQWLVPECDVSIRPGWFYHAAEDARVKTPEELVALYFESVGRGATLLLNLPPDRRGRIAEVDRAALAGMRGKLERLFARNVAEGHWSAPGWQKGAAGDEWGIAMELPAPERANVVDLREDIAQGQRVGRWVLEVEEGGRWRAVVEKEAIGARRLVRFEAATGARWRVRVTQTRGEPRVTGVGLYLEE